MSRIWRAITNVLFWTYSRGSWQYDLMCASILAFIFLTPREYFVKPPFYTIQEPKKIEQKPPVKADGKQVRVTRD